MKKRMVIFIICIQIILIAIIGYFIFIKGTFMPKKLSVNVINKGSVITTSSAQLKHYYEPIKNSVIDDKDISGIKYTINKDTLNERFDYLPSKQQSTFRIITLGDSFTYGLYVNTKDNWTELLEDKLNRGMMCKNISKFEVINLAVQGYDTQYEVERYKRRGQKYSPDLVVWFITDIPRMNELIYSHIDQIKVKSANNIVSNRDFINLWISIRDKIMREFNENDILKYQDTMLEKLREYYSGKVALISRPEMDDKRMNFLAQEAKKNNYDYSIKLRDFLNEKKNITDNFHPNINGHKMIAEDIFKYLASSDLIPCNN